MNLVRPSFRRPGVWAALTALPLAVYSEFARADGPTSATGQGSSSQAMDAARALFVEAEDARVSKRFAECVDKAQQAFSQFPQAQILGVLGLCEFELGKFADAAKHLRLYVADATNKVEPEMQEKFAKARARVTEVEVQCNQQDAAISIDGASIGKAPATVFLDPGKRTFAAQKEGYAGKLVSRDLLAGTKITIVLVLSREGESAGAAGLSMWPAGVGFGLAGAGALLGGGMMIASAVRASDAEEAAQKCKGSPRLQACLADGQLIADDVDTFRAVGVVGFVVAGAVLAFAIPYAAAASGTSAADEARLRVTPWLAPGFVGGSVEATF